MSREENAVAEVENSLVVNAEEKEIKVEKKPENEFLEELIRIGRIVKVTKGGRKFRFSVMMAVGDGEKLVGIGHGKAKEIPDATQKAIAMAKKRLVSVTKKGTTIGHEVYGKFGSTSVMLRPARKGTGVIAGGVVRAVLSKIGIQDIFSKIHGSKNSVNVVRATINALEQLKSPSDIAQKRNKKVDEIFQ
jgi:small subunit ribosomal protein S5